MKKVELIHNDDEVLSTTDSTLRTRGSIEIEGKEHGVWEQHTDGSYRTIFDGRPLQGASKADLIAEISRNLDNP